MCVCVCACVRACVYVCVRACVCVCVHLLIFVVCPFCQLPPLSAENWCNERGDLANLPSSLLVAPRETDNNVDQDLSRPDNNVSVYEPIDYNGTHPVGERHTILHVVTSALSWMSVHTEWMSQLSTKTDTLASVTVDGVRLRSLASRKL